MYNYLIYILEKIMEDTRRLIPISIKKLEDNLWNIKIDDGESYNVEGSLDEIKRALRRIKAKDGAEYGKCRSSKKGTYSSMVGEGDDNLHKINVWKSKVPHSPDDFKKLMESKEMKTITLTKNYLIEGNIVSKGTLITLKEKLDFLPSDIWEKAKEITDEHERFEFIKSELNKLGDTYSDDEIEDFINKYKSNLNESLTEKEVEGLGDMLDMLEETMESEDYVAKDKIDEILDIASGDEKLLKAWEAMSTADDKTFNKKENAFWSRFDEICKPFKK
jgi:hypothetical protein